MIPVIDLFAGPGGLGEGFSAFRDSQGKNPFKIVLSVEKDPIARETLKLRSFFRHFKKSDVPDEYYDYLRGDLDRDELYTTYRIQADAADYEAWNATLGDGRKFSDKEIDNRITENLRGAEEWILIGGPPCQAYSLVGRSRVIPVDRKQYENDHRHFLYKAYLRILAQHRPPVFVMENVKGLLSARVKGERIIERIISDLRHPIPAAANEGKSRSNGLEYKIFPLADYGSIRSLFDGEDGIDPANYIIRCEEHGIPQARHRLILLGVRSDLTVMPSLLRRSEERVTVEAAIGDLPRLRSKLSRSEDGSEDWAKTVRRILRVGVLQDSKVDRGLQRALRLNALRLPLSLSTGNGFRQWRRRPDFQQSWFTDSRLGGVCNHSTRGHMEADLWRYFFAACYAQVRNQSPTLLDFPQRLLPAHENVKEVCDGELVFADRFRVQIRNKPATTVTSHIGKDGHYFIHYDPCQCRSLTVREAARLQTFPDNYYFCGPVTAQYQQVGNAVPPLLARRIAGVVCKLFE